MNYGIYFDESNKLDQPNGGLSYYGALGCMLSVSETITKEVKELNKKLKSQSEMHFVEYTSDTNFEKYFRALNYVLEQDVKINLMIVNKEDARKISEKMKVTLPELRELFYVKIPERLFYGMTRDLKEGQSVQIIIDKNSEYEKIELEKKLSEQMNAHSAYRSKGYKVDSVEQETSDSNILLQLIDVLMGMVVFLLECQYKNDHLEDNNTTLKVKSDLVYRLLIHNDNLDRIHKKITLYKWGKDNDQVEKINISNHTGDFLIYKTRYDVQEMNMLAKLMAEHPSKSTRFYREQMGYKNQQLRTIQGDLDELKGMGRNGYYE